MTRDPADAAVLELAGAAFHGLYALAYRILRDADRTDDAIQSCLMRAWQQVPRLRDPDRFDAWLRRLLVNACHDEGRRQSREGSLRFLTDEGIPLVMVDGPQGFKSSIPPVVAATSPDLAIVRFHGRRTATWEDMKGRATVERFRYLYDEGQLREWVPRVLEASGGAEDTHVLMNNCYANYGSTNARELAALLADELASFEPRG